MKRKLLLLSFLGLTATGCASLNGPSGPYVGDGFIVGATKGPVIATANSTGTKKGESCAQNLFGLVSWGDNSITAAKFDGNIQKVTQVDFDRFSVLGLFVKVCTIVKGE